MELLQQQRGDQGKQAHGIGKASTTYMARKITHNPGRLYKMAMPGSFDNPHLNPLPPAGEGWDEGR